MRRINWGWVFDASVVTLAVMLVLVIGLVLGFLVMEGVSQWLKNLVIITSVAGMWIRFIKWVLGVIEERL